MAIYAQMLNSTCYQIAMMLHTSMKIASTVAAHVRLLGSKCHQMHSSTREARAVVALATILLC